MTNILQLRPLNLNVDGQPLCSRNKTDLIIDMSCYARILPPLETFIWSVPILFQFPPYAKMSPPKRDEPSSLSHHHNTICLFLSSKNICCHDDSVIPRSECCDPVLKENLRWELISYSELLWNLELTPPVIYCQTLNHQSQKPLISSSNVFDRLPWLQNVPKKNLDFQLEICQPCRLSRSNDFWSAERNWFHYFQIIRQQLLELNFTEMEGNQETVY